MTEPTKTPMELTEALVENMTFQRVGETTTTLCIVTLQGGFVVVGKSACVDPAKFSAVMGEKFAREDAMRQAVEHVAFWLVLSAATGAGAQA